MTSGNELFPGFAERRETIGDVEIAYRIGGRGPPVVLLHGYPQTHVAWHRVAPRLAASHTVVLPDLRGYGDSSCPPSDSAHWQYSKRCMGGDIATLMARLGHAHFSMVGHSRGARVTYRLALDRPDLVERIVLIDILSTWDIWQPQFTSLRGLMSGWSFLAQPAPIPETLIGSDPHKWLASCLNRSTAAQTHLPVHPAAMAAYRRAFADPDRIHASCEDYRAGATCDLADDALDRRVGRRIVCPMLVVVASDGSLATVPDVANLWRPWCTELEVETVVSGHYVAEENPDGLLAVVEPFLAAKG